MSNLPADHQRNEQPANDAGYAALMAIKPGERLRQGRKALKLDLEAAASQMNLSVSVICALEQDDYRALPSSTFIKGYIRGYARMLRLPADDLVRAYEYQTGVHSSMDEQHPVPERANRKGLHKGVVLLIIAVIVGALLLLSPEETAKEGAAPPTSGDVTDLDAVDDLAVLEAESDVPVYDPVLGAELVASYDEPDGGESESDEAGDGLASELDEVGALQAQVVTIPAQAERIQASPTPLVEAESESVAVSNVSSQPLRAQRPVAVADLPTPAAGVLRMSFSDDCWVEVRNQQGKLVHADLHRAGSRYEKSFPEPFEVKLGNGNAVQLSYNGDPVAFAPSSRTSVARLKFGE